MSEACLRIISNIARWNVEAYEIGIGIRVGVRNGLSERSWTASSVLTTVKVARGASAPNNPVNKRWPEG